MGRWGKKRLGRGSSKPISKTLNCYLGEEKGGVFPSRALLGRLENKTSI